MKMKLEILKSSSYRGTLIQTFLFAMLLMAYPSITYANIIQAEFTTVGIGKNVEDAKADADGKGGDAHEAACSEKSDDTKVCQAVYDDPDDPGYSNDETKGTKGWDVGTSTIGGTEYSTAKGYFKGKCKCTPRPKQTAALSFESLERTLLGMFSK